MSEKHYLLTNKMRKAKYFISSFSLMALLFSSCADGFDNNEVFSGGVTNTTLKSPAIDKSCFSTVTNSDGSEYVKLTWPIVYGAGGYEFNLSNIDDPENPVAVIQDSIIDGCSMLFKKTEDTNFLVSVRTLGNDKLSNKAAENDTEFPYSTLVPATTIPEGEEISSFIKSNLQSSDDEQAFELEAGKTYHLDDIIDFDKNVMTFRGNKINRPTVIVGENGGIKTQAGLKLKFINFDCSALSSIGLVSFSDTPDASLSAQSLGYVSNSTYFIIDDPVIFQECNIKDLKNSLIWNSKKNWNLRDFRILDCIIQLDNSGSNPVINMANASASSIKNWTMKNSTFYNLKANSSTYFIRNANSSNAQPKKVWGDAEAIGGTTIQNCTFCRTMTGKDFGNNIASTGSLTIILKDNIFYDVYRINKGLSSQGTRTIANNLIFEVTKTIDGNDAKLGTQEDPQFEGSFESPLDLSLPNGGVNFKPQSATALQNQIGDPRWLN